MVIGNVCEHLLEAELDLSALGCSFADARCLSQACGEVCEGLVLDV